MLQIVYCRITRLL